MLPDNEGEIFDHRAPGKRFSAEEARRILDLAAREQARRDPELDGSYSAEELEEIAAEAGIAPEALHAAMESPRLRFGLGAGRRSVSRLPGGIPLILLGLACCAVLILLVAIPDFAFAFAFVAVLLLLAVMIAA